MAIHDAAVLIPIFLEKNAGDNTNKKLTNCSVLYTVRASNLEHHPGQISFPGGVKDKTDTSLFHTACREAEEEIGLSPKNITLLCELAKTPTVASPFIVTPFAATINASLDHLKPNKEEIDSLIVVPLIHLLNPRNSKLENFKKNNVEFTLKSYFFENHRIWGATAKITENLIHYLEANHHV